MRVPKDVVPDMPQARSYYDDDYHKSLTWWFTREEIGLSLRGHYEVPKELPPRLLALVSKLDTVESNQSPRSRTLKRLDAIEGKYLSRYAPPAEPRSVGPSDDWPVCT